MKSSRALRRLCLASFTGPALLLTLTACGDDGDSNTPAPIASASASVSATGSASVSSVPSTSASAQASLPVKTYQANDAKIQYMGRFDVTDPEAPVTSGAGAALTIRFDGNSVTALIEDELKYSKKYRVFYDVVVDGVTIKKVAADPDGDNEKLELVTPLDVEAGEHTLSLVRRSEPELGQATYRGFEIGGELLTPPPVAPHKIVFIGDSITAGAGAEAENNSPECGEDSLGMTGGDGWGQPYHNAHRSYAPVAAALLDAQYHLVAMSGRGLVRNYSSQYDARPIPETYDLMFAELDKSMSVQVEVDAGVTEPADAEVCTALEPDETLSLVTSDAGDAGDAGVLGSTTDAGDATAPAIVDGAVTPAPVDAALVCVPAEAGKPHTVTKTIHVTDPKYLWDGSRFVPDAVVVALGTNDFSPGDASCDEPREKMDIDTWADTWIEFVEHLRESYPEAHFFAMQSPMLGDWAPCPGGPTIKFRTDHNAALEKVRAHYEALGDDSVHIAEISKVSGAGCGTHPSLEEHESIAAELAEQVESAMGW